jgi:hypothetical protein
VARAVTRCPNCGTSVSQFAAGCAICGEDLVAARQKRAARYDAIPQISAPSWLSQVSRGEVLLGACLILIAVFAPVIGILVALLVAFFAHRSGETVQRNIALAAVAVGVAVLILLSFFPSTWDLLLPWVNDSGPFTQ